MKQKKSDKKKIVFFVLPLKFFISHRLPIALRAHKSGYEVHVISSESNEKSIIEENGLVFHNIDIRRRSSNPFSAVGAIYKIYKLYKQINPDIVHHITIKPLLYGTLAARMANVPGIVNAFSGLGFIFTASGVKAFLVRNLIKSAYKIILRYRNLVSIIQNRDDLSYLISKAIIKKDQTVLIKGSGVDLNTFKLTTEPDGPVTVILPARLLRDKGVEEFYEASKILHKRNVPVRMVLVGDVDDGNPTSVANDELASWVSEGVVEHWGFSNNMPMILSKAHIVCLPSYREGMPKSLIEATAAGRAIITTDVPGCREMIDTARPNGLLISVKNANAIADAIEELVRKPEKRLQMGRNGRLMAEKQFSIDHVVERTMEIYQSLLFKNSPR